MIALVIALANPLLQHATEDGNSNVRDAAREALEKIEEVSTGC